VSDAGDLDGDGIPDFALGAPARGVPGKVLAGRAQVVSGSGSATLRSFFGEAHGDRFGESLAAGGDADGDGARDLVVGASRNDAAAQTAGRAYLFEPGAFAVPSEILGLAFPAPAALTWASAAGEAGPGTTYDVLRGVLAELPVGSGGGEICLEAESADPAAEDDDFPPAGGGYFYLVRGANASGSGGYGADSSALPRESAACP
jgi:hypothetical protein